MEQKPEFKQNRGRKKGVSKYNFPKEKGQFLTLPFTDAKNLVAIRNMAHRFKRINNLKYRTWVDGSNIVIEAL
jgi:hypothetical protein